MKRVLISLGVIVVAAVGFGQAGKPASVPTSAKTTATASVPASMAATPEAAWAAVLKALKAGDRNAVANVTTPKGYKSTMGERGTLSPDQMRCRGKAWAELKIRFSSKTDKTAVADLGVPLPSEDSLRFVRTSEGWKLDEILGGD